MPAALSAEKDGSAKSQTSDTFVPNMKMDVERAFAAPPLRVNAAGGNARLTVYEGVAHPVWLNVYSDAEVFKWLSEHK